MKHELIALLVAGAMFSITTTRSCADDGPQIVESRTIWSQPESIAATDLVRFRDHWFCVYETGDSSTSIRALEVIASANGADWESVVRIEPPTENGTLFEARLEVVPDDRLMLTGVEFVPQSSWQSLYWISPDGRDWGEPKNLGDVHFIHSGAVSHDGDIYSYGYGCICGIAQTVQIRRNWSGQYFSGHFEHNFSGFFPKAASLVFDGDEAVCILSRSNGPNSDRLTLIGRSAMPYTDWDWTLSPLQTSHPNSIRMPDGRIVASLGLREPELRTSLCVFDNETGQLDEVLELPIGGRAIDVGLETHDDYLWVSYHVAEREEHQVRLLKVALSDGQ